MWALESISLQTWVSIISLIITSLLSLYVYRSNRKLKELSLTPSVSLTINGPIRKLEYMIKYGDRDCMEYYIINSSNFPAHNVEVIIIYENRNKTIKFFYPSLASYPHMVRFLVLPTPIQDSREEIPEKIIIRYGSYLLNKRYEITYVPKILGDKLNQFVTFELRSSKIIKL